MNAYFDIHTHHSHIEAGKACIVNCSPDSFAPGPEGWYSVGIHPWSLPDEVPQEAWKELQAMAGHPQVLAVGEAGLDKLATAPMELQEAAFVRQAAIAETVGKPLIVHLVKATDGLLRLKKRMNPRIPWLVHGFRGKAQLAEELLHHGLFLSFGAKFQEEAVRTTPMSRLLIETDESPVPIAEIYARVAAARQIPLADLCEAVRANVQSVFFHQFSLR